MLKEGNIRCQPGQSPVQLSHWLKTLHREPRFKHSRQDTPRVAPKHSLVSNGRVWAGPPAGAGKAASELAIRDSDPGEISRKATAL